MSRTYRTNRKKGVAHNAETFVKSHWYHRDDTEWYDVLDRDGKWNESGLKAGLRNETNRRIRRSNKQEIFRYLNGNEDVLFSDKYTFKSLIWNYF